MKAGFWKCPVCESLNPNSATTCETCPPDREPGELAGATHLGHLAASVADKSRWRVASAGPGYVVVAARSRTDGEAKGAQLLKQEALADQRVVVTEVRRRGWLVYVRSALTPYPSALKPWQSETVRPRPPEPMPSRDPVEGRTYIGQVLEWVSDEGHGSISFADRRIENISVRRSDLNGFEEATMRTGQYVGFVIKKTPEGLFATDIMPLGRLGAGE